MIDQIVLFLLKTGPYVKMFLIIFCLVKLLLFMVKKNNSWQIHHFFYFNNAHLSLSHSQKSYNNKKLQNNLTLIITLLAGLLILNTFLSYIIN